MPIQSGLGLPRVTCAFLTSRPFSEATHPENCGTKGSDRLPSLSNSQRGEHVSLVSCSEHHSRMQSAGQGLCLNSPSPSRRGPSPRTALLIKWEVIEKALWEFQGCGSEGGWAPLMCKWIFLSVSSWPRSFFSHTYRHSEKKIEVCPGYS